MKPLSECHVLVTPTSYGANDPKLRQLLEASVGKVTYNATGKPYDSAALCGVIADVDGYIAGLDVIDASVIERAERLTVIARYGVGVSNVDLEAAKQRGIAVTVTPGANSKSVAELTIAQMLNLLRPMLVASADTRQGGWMRTKGLSLEGKTVGLVGFGAIGHEVARRLEGFDCHVVAHDPVMDTAFAAAHKVEVVTLPDLLAQADIVSLHVPVLDSTREMVNAEFLALMKPGAVLINTARGELIDEEALVAALESGKVKGAALDVFQVEPPGADHPLMRFPQVIPTPHMGSHTDGATNAMGWGALENCLAVLRGEEAPNRVV